MIAGCAVAGSAVRIVVSIITGSPSGSGVPGISNAVSTIWSAAWAAGTTAPTIAATSANEAAISRRAESLRMPLSCVVDQQPGRFAHASVRSRIALNRDTRRSLSR